jgi:hypothetical protein
MQLNKKNMKKLVSIPIMIFVTAMGFAQEKAQDSENTYKKRVLETAEVEFLASYYTQDGDNAAVTGGLGSEKLTDVTSTLIVSIPLNDDDVLTVDTGISAYTSASSSNINPFDGNKPADPFQASSGASASDVWANGVISYAHSSDDRNNIWSAKLSVSAEFDYYSLGLGGGYTKLFNEKNTELSVNANIYLDTWKAIYPIELRPSTNLGRYGTIWGNTNYNPIFTPFNSEGRNSYSAGFGFSQILSKRLQGALMVDFVNQQGLLSMPFQRVYFGDVANSFIENFQLADAIEQLPNNRTKLAVGGRMNYYINEIFVLRTYYRYYADDWGITSQTASIELPIKITDKFTLYPSYRFYNQTAANYFAPYEQHRSTEEFYTSDYDLSKYSASQYGFGITYTDIFTRAHIYKFGLKSLDLKFNQYERNSGLKASIVTAGLKFIMD